MRPFNWSKLYPLPYRYMTPGLLTFVLFMILPIFFTVLVGFTNLGTGHMLSQRQVNNLLKEETYTPENSPLFNATIGKHPGLNQHFLQLVETEKSRMFFVKLPSSSTDKILMAQPGRWPEEVKKLKNAYLYRLQHLLKKIQIQIPDGPVIQQKGLSTYSQQKHRYHFLSSNTVQDVKTQKIYEENLEKGFYQTKEGIRLNPGFVTFIGTENFSKLFTDPQIARPFINVFIWTFIWAFFTVFLTFSLGITLALILNKAKMRFSVLYRMLLIIPYSIPFFISVLVFKGMMNKDFGIINELLPATIPWLTNPWWAKVSCLLVNLWLGFPYMLLVTTGILQSIPQELYEAAKLDGAPPLTSFFKITLPLIFSAIGPLLVGTFAFNFNNFVGIYLLTGGGPPMEDVSGPVGETDILISYTYRLAFEGGQGQDFGLASSIAIIIFLIITILTLINFKVSGMMKEQQA